MESAGVLVLIDCWHLDKLRWHCKDQSTRAADSVSRSFVSYGWLFTAAGGHSTLVSSYFLENGVIAHGARPPQADKPVDLKRARLEKDVLEGMLFRLFERQSTWNFGQLQKETDQPAMWLKARVLVQDSVEHYGTNVTPIYRLQDALHHLSFPAAHMGVAESSDLQVCSILADVCPPSDRLKFFATVY